MGNFFEDVFDEVSHYPKKWFDDVKEFFEPPPPAPMPDPAPREITGKSSEQMVARGKRRSVLLPRDLGELKLSQPFLLGRRGT